MSEDSFGFLQAVEIWVPDGDLLQWQSGAYGDLGTFAEASMSLTLRKGQGLPGAAWATMRPEVWHELGPRFVRADPARAAGLEAAIALPFFRGHEVVAIAVFFCGSREQAGGCIEVWEPHDSHELVHADGYYGRLEDFENFSRELQFARGEGLPGIVWKHGLPRIIPDLGSSESFIRARAARESGVTSGLGIPLYCGRDIAQVVLFLSAESTPLARAFEVWIPDSHGTLAIEQAYYASGLDDFGEQSRSLTLEPGVDLAGAVFDSGVPLALNCRGNQGFLRRKLAERAGLGLAVALPVVDGDEVRAVVVMLS